MLLTNIEIDVVNLILIVSTSATEASDVSENVIRHESVIDYMNAYRIFSPVHIYFLLKITIIPLDKNIIIIPHSCIRNIMHSFTIMAFI